MDGLEVRVRRLEHAVRALGCLALVGWLAVAAVAAGRGPQREVRASRFVVVDENDAVQAEFGWKDGAGTSLVIAGGKADQSAGLGIDDAGSPYFAMTRRDDKATIAMGFDRQGGEIAVLDGKGRTIFTAPPRRPR